jgi:hypothetical protein
VGTGQPVYNLVQGSTWIGDFNSGEGLIYNGVANGNTPTDIAADFNQPETGVGAYIQSQTLGSFTATITLFDINFQPIGSFSTGGTATATPGTALFIGALSTTPVWAVQFDAVGTGPAEPNFAIGTMGLPTTAVPEPSFLLVIPAFGLAIFLLRRPRTNAANRLKLHAFVGSLAGLATFCSTGQAQSAIDSSTYVKAVSTAARQSGRPRPLVPISMVGPGHVRPHIWVTGHSVPVVKPAVTAASVPSFCNTNLAPGYFGFCWNGLQTAYGSNFPGANGGAGITVAIVDAYHYAGAASDLAFHSSLMALPACPVGTCFNQVNQVGGPPRAPANSSWETETMLDLEAVHSIAPNAKILLVEGDDASITNLNIAVGYASANADIVSNSYGGSEFDGENTLDVAYSKPVLYSSGDSGAPGEYPCYSPYVTCVGVTTLSVNSSLQRLSETGWSGSGGGCSGYEAAVAYQTGFVGSTLAPCTTRANPDVAADANPNSGLLVYDSNNYPGEVVLVGGSSLACPLTAGLFADVMAARVSFGQPKFGEMNGDLYAAAARTPGPPRVDSYFFYDVTSGNNGHPAGPGYDLVTGLGVPVVSGMGNRFFGLVP